MMSAHLAMIVVTDDMAMLIPIEDVDEDGNPLFSESFEVDL